MIMEMFDDGVKTYLSLYLYTDNKRESAIKIPKAMARILKFDGWDTGKVPAFYNKKTRKMEIEMTPEAIIEINKYLAKNKKSRKKDAEREICTIQPLHGDGPDEVAEIMFING